MLAPTRLKTVASTYTGSTVCRPGLLITQSGPARDKHERLKSDRDQELHADAVVAGRGQLTRPRDLMKTLLTVPYHTIGYLSYLFLGTEQWGLAAKRPGVPRTPQARPIQLELRMGFEAAVVILIRPAGGKRNLSLAVQ